MIIASILGIWVVASTVFCVALAAAAARRAPRHHDAPAYAMDAAAHVAIEVQPDTHFEPAVVHTHAFA